ncbi:unnamed protein product [Lupinus luteus]|uniref:Uncharacterized protein n=1 Tax=Lupinus luteus TaxID=3873 RepID=A0AAV1XP82_LUPLU
MQLKALQHCKEFLVGNVSSDCDEDEIDDEDEDELVHSYGSEESKEYKFFERLFAEDGDLRRYYESNHKEGAFYCLVCGPVWKKIIGWEFDQLPVIVLKDLDNSVAGPNMLLDEARKPAINHIGDSNKFHIVYGV